MIFRVLVLLLSLTFSRVTDLSTSKLIFSDEFNASMLDLNSWSYDLGDGCPSLCGWGNNEFQVYTKSNVSTVNNQLVISATKQEDIYHSGRITTKDKFEFTYGTIEVKAQLPKGKGLWPAIWMLGHDIDSNSWPYCGEIDIMEYVGKSPGEIHTTLHTKHCKSCGTRHLETRFFKASLTARKKTANLKTLKFRTFSLIRAPSLSRFC